MKRRDSNDHEEQDHKRSKRNSSLLVEAEYPINDDDEPTELIEASPEHDSCLEEEDRLRPGHIAVDLEDELNNINLMSEDEKGYAEKKAKFLDCLHNYFHGKDKINREGARLFFNKCPHIKIEYFTRYAIPIIPESSSSATLEFPLMPEVASSYPESFFINESQIQDRQGVSAPADIKTEAPPSTVTVPIPSSGSGLGSLGSGRGIFQQVKPAVHTPSPQLFAATTIPSVSCSKNN